MNKTLCVLSCLAASSFPVARAAGDSNAAPAAHATSTSAGSSWSADLLRQVWNEKPHGGAAASNAPAPEGLSLRSYQLRHLRVGEAGRAQNLVALIQKFLPPGGSLKADPPANHLHILTTPTVHASIWDLLSAIDQPEPSAATLPPAILPPELEASLSKLAGTPAAAQEILQELKGLRSRIDRREAEEASGRGSGLWPYAIPAAVLAAFLIVWTIRRRPKPAGESGCPAPGSDPSPSALMLSPEKIGAALAPMHQQLQQEVMGTLNQAAIRLESWYQEQKRHREELEQLAAHQHGALVAAQSALVDARSQWIAENRSLVESASGRFESVAVRLEVQAVQIAAQNDRVEALADELSRTVGELDRTKDEILRLEGSLAERDGQLGEARNAMAARERELANEQARLSALTLLLEEGLGADEPPRQPGPPVSNVHTHSAASACPTTTVPCPSQITPTAGNRFHFLPPNPAST